MPRFAERLRGATPFWLSATLLCGFGCRDMIGIEDAELDPALASDTAMGAASNGVGAPLTEGGAPTAGADAGAQAEAGLCERYCSAVTGNCQGPFAVYTSFESCLAVCGRLPAGQPGDRNVNSVECRLHAASIASSEVPHYCPIAGPGGNGECGTNCEGYCGLLGSVCAEWVPVEQATCSSDCQKVPDHASYTTDVGGQDYKGNHVQCRLYHLSAALANDAEQHCMHANGAAPCK